ncbi:hypothetical protein CQ040_16840 [Microbacterium sp. MYb54]|nr:hypothetical protein CQ032_16180 [Microbacterium sp. MYb43]PQZ73240.1 hypothetical protein CQ031_17535 [Microbacterium sp. MYb40]PRB18741.1 hypothetical protein CQ040_16840 [Microbacterium sp. MYb54]PRB24367.1 hypothetical protein CQ037_16955 [Microbacterium sp. MYb50]PRB67231.1 hypothetical protein CQ021_08260 [Microbacterium sp. MYb24]PRB69609.1 hypothetical protein CQ027_16975 [Microbacterium sp. MYb32]
MAAKAESAHDACVSQVFDTGSPGCGGDPMRFLTVSFVFRYSHALPLKHRLVLCECGTTLSGHCLEFQRAEPFLMDALCFHQFLLQLRLLLFGSLSRTHEVTNVLVPRIGASPSSSFSGDGVILDSSLQESL